MPKDSKLQVYEIGDDEIGKRADFVVAREIPELSRSYIKRLAHDGKLTFEGREVQAGYKLKRPGKLILDYDPAVLQNIPEIELDIIYEDDDVLAINKPAGLITHSRGRYWDEPSVASSIRKKLTRSGSDIRAGIVHRLDRATSGVIICAKTADAQGFLQKQFEKRTVQKEYIAICNNVELKATSGLIDMPIGRNPKRPSTFRVDAKGKSAQTNYQVLSTSDKYMMLRLSPRTGRTHQLRVHMEKLNAPIVGDTLYGGKEHDRLMLHAHKLKLEHPNGSELVLEAPLPPEFQELLHDN
ncbi:MAG: RluA family pseudouridine synthase [Patescibacteria group bacterium]